MANMDKFKNSYEDVKNGFLKEGYILVDDCYINNITFMRVICPFGHAWDVKWTSFITGCRCPKCNSMNKKITSLLLFQDALIKEGYELYDWRNFKTRKSKILVKCPNGHVYKTSYDRFKRDRRCRHCNISKGERKIRKSLTDNSIEFITEYKFKDCKNKFELPFDFYLPNYNLCIEYDGEQHYSLDSFSKDLLYLMNLKRRDNIKTKYCKDNNIDLLRIPYWDFDNIESIIKQKLKLK